MVSLSRRLGAGMGGVAVAVGLAGCAGPGQYIWFEQLPTPPQQTPVVEYIIQVGDVVSIRVLGHDDMSVRQRVRSDGRIGLFLIGEIEADGKRPDALRAELEGRLKDYIVAPSVAVNIEEAHPITIVLLGEVGHQGAVLLEQDPRLVHALALGGGLTDFASRDSIFVVRERPAQMRIRFTYEAISRNLQRAGEFQLQTGDVVEVE